MFQFYTLDASPSLFRINHYKSAQQESRSFNLCDSRTTTEVVSIWSHHTTSHITAPLSWPQFPYFTFVLYIFKYIRFVV